MSAKKPNLTLYADECIPIPTVTYLKTIGISIRHALDEDYLGKSDELQFKRAKKLKRVFLSLDRDFRKLKDVDMSEHPGAILITTGNNTPNHINKIIEKFIRFSSIDMVRHSVIRITIDKYTKEKNGHYASKVY